VVFVVVVVLFWVLFVVSVFVVGVVVEVVVVVVVVGVGSSGLGQKRFLRELSSFFLMRSWIVFLLNHATKPILH
jgi:hypothetical protein